MLPRRPRRRGAFPPVVLGVNHHFLQYVHNLLVRNPKIPDLKLCEEFTGNVEFLFNFFYLYEFPELLCCFGALVLWCSGALLLCVPSHRLLLLPLHREIQGYLARKKLPPPRTLQ